MRRAPAPLAALAAALIAAGALASGPGLAQGTAADKPPAATLIADRVSVGALNELVAEGNVEVLYGEARLRAARVVYDRQGDRLSIEGPITLTTGPDTVMVADSAELSPDLTEGILRSARLVLNRQLQIAAADIQRVAGRYTRMGQTVASACRVCSESEVPLWQIRASRIIHDQQELQIYFDNARLEVMGVPVFYLPRLRVPDPALNRASGFLTPKFRVTNQLGTGIKIPYFLTLGDHQDLLITPYVSTSRTRTLELRYRGAFRKGDIAATGAISRDDLIEDETRYYLFADGGYDLPRDFRLDFGIEAVSDPAYLLDYDYSDKDRLKSGLSLTRARRDELITADLAYLETLRASESNRTIPSIVGDVTYRRRMEPPGIGGIAGVTLSADGLYRRSDDPLDGTDFDIYGDGLDLGRISAGIDWRRDWVLDNGMLLGVEGALDIDRFHIADDAAFAGSRTRTTPAAAVELRWPLVKAGADGATHVLEPVAQLAWSREDNGAIPNEDSVLVEFDEANLFSLTRFAGEDAREAGLRFNLGVGWTRHDPAGWSLGLTVGRIWREENLGQFAAGSGLDGQSSDWLAALELDLPGNLSLSNRALFDDGFDFTRNDLRIDWYSDRVELGSNLLWAQANPSENRPDDRSEWVMDAAYRFRDNWTGKADWRYDFVAEDATRAGIGLEYRNECVTVDLSLSRRFTSSTSVEPSTDFGLTVSLAGFGARGDGAGLARRCARF
ncbi:LPS-assembly protein LptD [Rhodovulum euryhalinum]|uniref:LPS-assembly protein LptD n=1 Tax=Rhodovulum euryhalinum TaxID=35805 RepID=A0A4R2KUU6_9RHOB|nr:LPS assembly protein LptD [Rhodovulum euryhalinum]TCO70485.1 LPS-assembly protein [Rhodovulum euryhalinum]